MNNFRRLYKYDIDIFIFVSVGMPRAWIGLYTGGDANNAALYKWVSNGQSPKFSDWSEGQPNNYGGVRFERCGELWGDHDYKWNNSACGMECPFICEIPL